MIIDEQITVITVAYRSGQIIPEFLKQFSYAKNIIVVNNSPDDGLEQIVKRDAPAAEYLGVKNLGFGGGNNAGVDRVKTPYALMVNPDCSVTESNLEKMFNTAQAFAGCVVVGPQIRNESGKSQTSYRWDFLSGHAAPNEYFPAEGPCCAMWLDGSCYLVRVDRFRKMGGFDKLFFMYFEEDDLGLRARKNDFSLIHEPDAYAMHKGNSSSAPSLTVDFRKKYFLAKSRINLIFRYKGSVSGALLIFRIIVIAPFAIVFFLCTFQQARLLKWTARLLAAITPSQSNLLKS